MRLSGVDLVPSFTFAVRSEFACFFVGRLLWVIGSLLVQGDDAPGHGIPCALRVISVHIQVV